MKLEFRDKVVELSPGDMYIIPRGVEHKPIAEKEVHLMLFEPTETKHTGKVKHERTVEKLDWI